MLESPRRKHKSLNIKIAVFECTDDKQIREFRIDLANSNKKDWVYNLILWATLNGKEVTFCNEKDGIS